MNLNFRHLLAVILMIVFTASSYAAPKREFRAPWVATVFRLDWPTKAGTSQSVINKQKQEIDTYVQQLSSKGFTAFCFQIRSMCDAMYKSKLAPWSSYLTGTRGTEPGWDPLQYAIDKCHEYGLECHAWMNPFRWSSGTDWNTKYDKNMKNNGWLLTGSDGKYKVVNPGMPEVRQYVIDVCREVVENYNVDGILFDDYFYPSGGTSTSSDAEDYQMWKDANSGMSFGDWRRNNVRICIKGIYDMIQSIRPDVRFGISPAGVAGTAETSASKYGVEPCPTGSDWQYAQIYSDPLSWLYDGTIDYISPQLYWATDHSTNPFGPLTEWWSYCADHFGRHHYASHSISRLGSNNSSSIWDDYIMQVNFSRQYTKNNASGSIYYSAAYINGHKASGLGDYLHSQVYQTKALSPVITWKAKKDYAAPANITLSGNTLSWDKVTDGNRIIKYTVYAFPKTATVESIKSKDRDGIKVEYLQGVTYTNSFKLPSSATGDYAYAVCVYDGFGNENTPGFYGTTVETAPKAVLLTPANNTTVNWVETFSWERIENGKFTLEISSDSEFTDIVITKNLTSRSVRVNLNTLADGKSFFWRVRTRVDGKISSVSDVFKFTTPVRPKAPVATLIAPNEGEIIETDVTFEWKNVDVDSYTLEIASTSNFKNISNSFEIAHTAGNTASTTVPASVLGKGTFFWRVKSNKADMVSTVSDVRSFKTTKDETGKYEPGYAIKTDGIAYSNQNNIGCTNLWMRSIKDNFNNFTQTENGLMNRGMCASGDFVYLSGRFEADANSAVYLAKYDGKTGEHIKDITLSSGSAPYFPCNDVVKDSYGNICIVNMTIRAHKQPIIVHHVDVETGEATLIAECYATETGLNSPRIDHAAVTGDVTSGDFFVLAAIAKSDIVMRWTYKNNELTNTEMCTLKSFYPETDNLGIAPVVIPINEEEFFVTGELTAFSRYTFNNGKMIDSFANNTPLAPIGLCANGGTFFTLGESGYIVYPYSDNNNPSGFSFNIGATNGNFDFAPMAKYWNIPEIGLGNFDSRTWRAVADYAEVGEGFVRVYVYAPGNGLAGYLIEDKVITGVEQNLAEDGLNIYSVNNTVKFNTEVDEAEVYSMTGMFIGRYSNVEQITLNTLPGAYIVKASKDGKISSKVVIIR